MDRGFNAICVLVAVETRIYQEGIGQVLDGSEKTRAVASASTEAQIMKACAQHTPDVLLLDSNMPDALGITVRVRKQHPDIKLIVLALEACQRQMLAFAREGVAEFLTRGDSLTDLRRCIDAAMSDGFWCSRRVADIILQAPDLTHGLLPGEPAVREATEGDLASLTPQQVKVLEYIETGMSNKHIARQLNIETATVKNHVHQILQRLGVTSRGEAAATFRRESFRVERPKVT